MPLQYIPHYIKWNGRDIDCFNHHGVDPSKLQHKDMICECGKHLDEHAKTYPPFEEMWHWFRLRDQTVNLKCTVCGVLRSRHHMMIHEFKIKTAT